MNKKGLSFIVVSAVAIVTLLVFMGVVAQKPVPPGANPPGAVFSDPQGKFQTFFRDADTCVDSAQSGILSSCSAMPISQELLDCIDSHLFSYTVCLSSALSSAPKGYGTGSNGVPQEIVEGVFNCAETFDNDQDACASATSIEDKIICLLNAAAKSFSCIRTVKGETPIPTGTPSTPFPTNTPTDTVSPTDTPTQTPTETPTNTPPGPTQTPTPTDVPPEPTQTPTNTPTQTPTDAPPEPTGTP